MKYLSEKINKDLKKLYFHRVLTALAVQTTGIFSTIFIYEYLDKDYLSLFVVFLILAIFSVLAIPSLGLILNKIGYRGTVILGSLFRVFLWVSLFVASYWKPDWALFFVFLALLGIRVFYWVPYYTEFGSLRNKKDHARSISILNSINYTVAIFAPALAGFILSSYSYNFLFALGVFFLLMAIIPLFGLKKIKNNKIEWSYFQTFRKLLQKKNKFFFMVSFFKGMESAVASILWPIFIFLLLSGDYFKIGFLVTLTTLFVVIFNIFLGKYYDKKKAERKVLKYSTFLYSLGWIVKIFVTTAGQIFFVDIYHKIMGAIYNGSYQTIIFGYIIDKGHLMDEYTLLRELSFRIGNVVAISLMILFTFLIPLNYIFVLAALSILMLNFVPKYSREEELLKELRKK